MHETVLKKKKHGSFHGKMAGKSVCFSCENHGQMDDVRYVDWFSEIQPHPTWSNMVKPFLIKPKEMNETDLFLILYARKKRKGWFLNQRTSWSY